MATVKVIPPKEAEPKTLRVAAYCRVSSDSADQLHSYAAQIMAYTDEIEKHPNWALVDIYADEAVTGTRMEQRDEFNRMIADCRRGKIDRILVKSTFRFARNTKDFLTVLRELTSLGVSVYFEEDHIDSLTLTSELMVSVYSALAQEESASIGLNQRMSYQRRMERGEFITCYAPLGYRIRDGKELEIVEEEAELVRWMFDSYLAGHGSEWIAEQLQERGIPTSSGRGGWRPQTVQKMLANEKYTGCTLCQKTYTTNAFPFVRKINRGDADQYYAEKTHPAIISADTFQKVQELMRKRAYRKETPVSDRLLTKKITCGRCGSTFIRKESQKGYVTWCCLRHNRKASDCDMGRIPEPEIYSAFQRMYGKLKGNMETVLLPALVQMGDLNNAVIKGSPAMLAVNRAIAEASEQSHKLAEIQARQLVDEAVCSAKLREISLKITQLRRERRRIRKNEDIEDAMETLQQTIGIIETGPEKLDQFDEDLFLQLVEGITAESPTCIRFRLYGGIALTEHLREAGR
ncbi:MAG: recombinase family protein [Oscillibacter sp.]|nr:recombinase family protein [Oscillibacter sp.]